MTTATQQVNIPTWKEVIGNALLVEYELKFDVNFSQRKHIRFITCACVCVMIQNELNRSFHVYFMMPRSLLGDTITINLKEKNMSKVAKMKKQFF